MKNLNILMLGAAKRVSVGRMLIAEGEKLGYRVNLFAYELSRDVAISSIAKIIEGKRWSDAEVVDDLLAICEKKRIHIILPFVDPAIAICDAVSRSNARVFFPGPAAPVAVSLFNKRIANGMFENALLPVPLCLDKDNITFPAIFKPKCGSASQGIVVAQSADDLSMIKNFDDYLIQEYIADRDEITVDCYISKAGDTLVCSPRLRLEVAGGEVVRTITINGSGAINRLCDKAIRFLSLTGAVTIQLIRDRRDRRLMIMEINPRLGGGVVCSVHAGANIPELIIREALALPLAPMPAKPNVEIARYPQEVVVKP